MAWSDPIYCVFANRSQGIAFGAILGIEFPADGSIPSGNQNFALVEIPAPWSVEPTYDDEGNVVTPGERQAGSWFLGRINLEWSGATDTLATIDASGARRTPDAPPVIWA